MSYDGYDGMPQGYAEIFQQLDKLNARGSAASSNATKYRSIAEKSREGLNAISGKVQELADIIKELKGLLATLSRTNVDLQTRLEQINRECDANVARAVEKMEEETRAVRQKCEEEKRQLQSETIANSEMEKRKALAELDQQAQAQIDEIQKASTREIESIKAEQLNLNERILNALKNVARNQEIVITGLESALTGGDPDQLNVELSSIQQQVLSLLDSIKVELERSMTEALPQAPTGPVTRSIEPRARQPEPRAQTPEIPPNYSAPNIDFSSPVRPLSATPTNDEKFEYMLKTLNNDKNFNKLNDDYTDRYNNQVLRLFEQWKQMSKIPTISNNGLKDQKNLLYQTLYKLFKDIYPSANLRLNQVGGKSRKHRKVHFKTRGGGKKRGKRTKRHKKAKRSHTKRH